MTATKRFATALWLTCFLSLWCHAQDADSLKNALQALQNKTSSPTAQKLLELHRKAPKLTDADVQFLAHTLETLSMTELNFSQHLVATYLVGTLGKKGQPCTRLLCVAAFEHYHRDATFEAIEKVNPKVYQSAVTLVLDRDPSLKLQALAEASRDPKSYSDLAPLTLLVIPGLCQELRFKPESCEQAFSACEKLCLRQDDRLECYRVFATLNATAKSLEPLRKRCVAQIIGEGDKQREARPAAAKLLASLLEKTPPVVPESEFIQVIDRLGSWGRDAAPAVPSLRKLKLHEAKDIREAAGKAVRLIEK